MAKGHNYEIVRALETHPKVKGRIIEIEIYVGTCIQV
jgi:hypothetical protein